MSSPFKTTPGQVESIHKPVHILDLNIGKNAQQTINNLKYEQFWNPGRFFYWPHGKPDLTKQQPEALVKLCRRLTRKPLSPQGNFFPTSHVRTSFSPGQERSGSSKQETRYESDQI